jgi:hypothetical protein
MPKIKVKVIEGKELSKGSMFDKSDPYCALYAGHQKFKTRVHDDGGSKPVWNQEFTLDCDHRDSFELEVFDKENLGADKSMGKAKVLIANVLKNEREDTWIALDKKGKYGGQVHLEMSIAHPPPKFVNVNGAPKLNQDYLSWQPQNQTSLTPQQTSYALPVISTMQDYQSYNQAAGAGQERPLPPSLQQTLNSVQHPQFAQAVGVQGDALQMITPVFSKYEIPIGMLEKLMALQHYHAIQFIIDDSGSMGIATDAKDPNGMAMTRWQEAQLRLKTMIEIMAFVPIPHITIEFLNRPAIIELDRGNKHPHSFVNEAWMAIDSIFGQGPSGGTPFYEKIVQSLTNPRFLGKRTIRYFFGDGQPNGGYQAVQAIVQVVTNRERPQDNPITLVSCTNEDSEVEWMKQLEEAAPYTSEVDDFQDERREIQEDQGIVFPFTNGFYLIGLLVGAMNPFDLDAMDESVPFTKYSIDSLLGIQYSTQEYFQYFDTFVQTQSRKPVHSPLDQIKKGIDWRPYYNDFLTIQGTNNDIPAVVEFKKRVKEAALHYRRH